MTKQIKTLLLITFLLITNLCYSQEKNKVNVLDYTMEILKYNRIKVHGPKSKTYVKITLWTSENYKKYNENGDPKYKYIFKQEGKCNSRVDLDLTMSVNDVEHVLVVTKVIDGVMRVTKGTINPKNYIEP